MRKFGMFVGLCLVCGLGYGQEIQGIPGYQQYVAPPVVQQQINVEQQPQHQVPPQWMVNGGYEEKYTQTHSVYPLQQQYVQPQYYVAPQQQYYAPQCQQYCVPQCQQRCYPQYYYPPQRSCWSWGW